MLAGTALASVLAVALNLPWALHWTWDDLTGAPTAGASGRSVAALGTLASDGQRFAALALALYVPVLAALAISRAWRLTWSARGASLVIAFGGVLVLADRGSLGVAAPRPSLLAVPVALGLALCAAAVAGGFGDDVLDRGFGWRQPVGVLGNIAIVIGLVPGVIAIGHGAWHTPDTPLTTFLDSLLPVDAAVGDYRVLYVGDPRVLPVPGREFAPGIAYAVVDAGTLDFTDRFVVPETEGDEAVIRALELIADGSTLRAGRLLAPHGIRFVVFPETDGVASTDTDPIELPTGLVAAFQNQLDIGSVPGPPALEVFQNESWMPVGAQLTGNTAEASRLAGDAVLVRSDLTGQAPVLQGIDARLDGLPQGQQVQSGVVHIAIPYDPRLHLEVGGRGSTRDPRSASPRRSTSRLPGPSWWPTSATRLAHSGWPCSSCCGSPCWRSPPAHVRRSAVAGPWWFTTRRSSTSLTSRWCRPAWWVRCWACRRGARSGRPTTILTTTTTTDEDEDDDDHDGRPTM